MGFGLVMKRCQRCGCDFVASDERINYCDECYLIEVKPFEDSGGDEDEIQA